MSFRQLPEMTFDEFEYFYHMKIHFKVYHCYKKRAGTVISNSEYTPEQLWKRIIKNCTTIWIVDQPEREWRVPSPSRNSNI